MSRDPSPPPRSGVGRADLLRFLALADCDRLALEDDGETWLGYLRRREAPVSAEGMLEVLGTITALAAVSAPTPASGHRLPLQLPTLPAVVFREARPAPEPAESRRDLAEPLQPAATLPPSPKRLVGYQPLVPEARLLPALRRWLGAVRTGPLDLDCLSRQLATATVPRRLPRREFRRWHPDLVVVLDFCPRLWPYRRDMHRLARLLLRHCGRSGVSLRIVNHGPYGGWTDWLEEQTAKTPPIPEPWKMPPPATPVLIVGDLGLLLGADSGPARQWADFVAELLRHGANPLALAPLGSGQLDGALAKLLPIVRWSPDARPHPERADGAGQPEPEGLADLLALAAVLRRVDPPLLRELRRLLPEGSLNAGLEGALWCHPDIDAGTAAAVRSAARGPHLDRFRSELPSRHLDVARLRRQHHAHLPAALHWEELLSFGAHASGDALADSRTASDLALARQRLGELAAALARGSAALDAAAWREVARAIEARADPRMAHHYAGVLLPLVAERVCREQAAGIPPEVPDWVDLAELAAYLDEQGRGEAVPAWLVRDAESGCILLQAHPPGPRQSRMDEALRIDGAGVRVVYPQAGGNEPRDSRLNASGESKPSPSGRGLGEGDSNKDFPVQAGAGNAQGRHVRSHLYFAEQLPIPLAPLDGPVHFSMETSTERLGVQAVRRPRGVASWACGGEGITVASPKLAEESEEWPDWSLSLNADTVSGSGEDLLTTLIVPKDPGWSPPEIGRNAVLPFGLDKFGVFVDLTLTTEHGTATQRFRYLEPGSFLMGSPDDEPGRDDDEGPRHPVTLTQGYWLADTACTQALWEAVMGSNPSHFTGDPERPVEQVSWDAVQDFLRKLESLLPGVRADLPTEAEWEYACRAGTDTPFSFGANITPEQVNYDGNYPYGGGDKGLYRRQTVPVKSLPANAWGLYEMHGNVWEWCADGKRTYAAEPAVDPIGTAEEERSPRAARGGSWNDNAGWVRSAFRLRLGPGFVNRDQGFRLSLRSIQPGPVRPGGTPDGAPGGRPVSSPSLRDEGRAATAERSPRWFDRFLPGGNKRR